VDEQKKSRKRSWRRKPHHVLLKSDALQISFCENQKRLPVSRLLPLEKDGVTILDRPPLAPLNGPSYGNRRQVLDVLGIHRRPSRLNEFFSRERDAFPQSPEGYSKKLKRTETQKEAPKGCLHNQLKEIKSKKPVASEV